MKQVLIHTDGSCLGNPGPGGWAAILALPGTEHRREICGGYRLTTNNRMELLAAIEALTALKKPCAVELYTDSSYLANAILKNWLAGWRRRAWRKADGKPLPNADLWQTLARQLATHQVSFHWLKGHAGHEENERCDLLARTQARLPNLPPDEIYEKSAAHHVARQEKEMKGERPIQEDDNV